ncbi:DUF1758 domain-containing protein [Trichonephila clavipes]|nr:DUF1758 domain-containing protein [Trichonephila clavipes]
MYRQILVTDEDQIYQQILWRNNSNENIRTYKLKTVTYGLASASFLATMCIKQIALDNKDNSKLSRVLQEYIYMDDLLSGSDTPNNATSICKDIAHVLSTRGFHLRKWNSNSTKFLTQLSEHSPHDTRVEFLKDSNESSKVLGLFWNSSNDTFGFQPSLELTPPLTKRQLCGAHLLPKLFKTVLRTLKHYTFDVFYWTDSKIVLSWLSSHPRKWKTLVANRTSEIIEVLPTRHWRHVHSKENPSDIASRGIEPKCLPDCMLWWQGPPWLQLETSSLPKAKSSCDESSDEVKAEQKSGSIFNLFTHTANDVIHDLFEHYSSITKIIRLFAYCQRFIKNCKKIASSKGSSISSSHINPPTGQHGFFRPTREASKTDHTEFFLRPGTHQK